MNYLYNYIGNEFSGNSNPVLPQNNQKANFSTITRVLMKDRFAFWSVIICIMYKDNLLFPYRSSYSFRLPISGNFYKYNNTTKLSIQLIDIQYYRYIILLWYINKQFLSSKTLIFTGYILIDFRVLIKFLCKSSLLVILWYCHHVINRF